jgi:hypothetical protein
MPISWNQLGFPSHTDEIQGEKGSKQSYEAVDLSLASSITPMMFMLLLSKVSHSLAPK